MAASVLDSRVLLWSLLANRRDIDILTLELIGKYQIDREACDESGTRNGLAFELICCLEMIFDLQRTHLQARNPAEPNRIANRLPYLLSLSTAKGAFMCLVKLAADDSEWAQQSISRWIYIRALLSGVRMLCLHPNASPEDVPSNSVQQNQNFNLQSLNTEERLLTGLCRETLGQIPDMDRNLSLPTSAMKMYPMNDRLLREVARHCIRDFANDTTRKYWTLYDISWSIVAAFVQCLANGPSRMGHDIATLASSIANYAIEEINEFDSSHMNNNGTKETLLLADIVGILYPICKGEMIKNRWRDVYNHILDANTKRESVYQDPAYILALAKFRQTLTKRQKVLRDSDDDILELCSSITEAGLTAVHDYNHYGNSSRNPTNSVRFYVTNCHNSHIIAHDDDLSRLISENANHTGVQRAHLISFPQELCSVCRALSQRKTYTHLKELLPLNKILHVIDHKRQEMNRLRLERQSDFSAEAETIAKIPGRRPHSQKFEQPTSEHPSHIDRRGLQLKHAPSLSGLPAKIFPSKQNRLSRESSTLGSTPSSAKSETFPQDIKFQYLDDTKKNVTLSADGSLFVFWNTKQLEVHDDTGFKLEVSPLVETPTLAIASTNCCAVVSKKENYDIIKCYYLDSGLECYQQDFDSRVRCLAISADDVYLAVWLDTGFLYLISLIDCMIFQKFKPNPPESAVHCLSFSAKELLTISIRDGDELSAYNYSLSDRSISHKLGFSLPKYESDDQGISSGLHSPLKKLSCFTFWTNSGFPLLYDYGKYAPIQWERTLKNDLKIENRIYLAVWSSSGKTLVLVDCVGKVYKISINDMNSIEAMEIASTRRVNRKSYDVGQPQLLDVKISQDEAHIIIAWISKHDQAFVQTIPVDQSYRGTNKSSVSSPSSLKNMF